MKKSVLLKHLKEKGCRLSREGSNHSIYINIDTKAWTAIPRHPNIEERTVFRICKQLGIPKPKIN